MASAGVLFLFKSFVFAHLSLSLPLLFSFIYYFYGPAQLFRGSDSWSQFLEAKQIATNASAGINPNGFRSIVDREPASSASLFLSAPINPFLRTGPGLHLRAHHRIIPRPSSYW